MGRDLVFTGPIGTSAFHKTFSSLMDETGDWRLSPAYALLKMMVAQVCDLKLGEFVHTLGDAQLYSNHFDQVVTRLTRTPTALPFMTIDSVVKDFFGSACEDITLEGYEADPTIVAPIAI